jgi:hypothetical protein
VRGLVEAHIELARAEFEEIGDEVKRVAALGGLAAGILIFLGFLFPIGLLLFVGEWLFGSIGWGVLLFTELGVAIALTAVITALGVTGSRIGSAIGVGVVVAVVLGVVLGLALTNEGWSRLGASVFPNVEGGFRPLGTAMAFSAAVVGVIGLVLGARAGGVGGAIGGLIGGALLGVVIGALSAIRFGPGPGVALGIAVGGIVWIALVARALMEVGVDTEKLKPLGPRP